MNLDTQRNRLAVTGGICWAIVLFTGLIIDADSGWIVLIIIFGLAAVITTAVAVAMWIDEGEE